LTGCGGGGDNTPTTPPPSDTPPTTPPPSDTPPNNILTGKFLDSAVVGVQYTTNSQSGFTNTNGEFEYLAGEKITFKIGSIELNTGQATTAKEIITPIDLANSSTPDDVNVIRLLQLLQSLDQDNNPTNGITISDSVKNLASGSSLDITSDNFVTELNKVISELTTGTGTVVSEGEALSHFYETLASLLSDGNKLNLPPVVVPEFSEITYIVPASQNESGKTEVSLSLNPGASFVTIQYGTEAEVNMLTSANRLSWYFENTLTDNSGVIVTIRLKSKNGRLINTTQGTLRGPIFEPNQDNDGDGVLNQDDAFPNDASETLDFDNDEIGNNADPDDDNDGIVDGQDAFPFDATNTTKLQVYWPTHEDKLNAALVDSNGETLEVSGIVEINSPKNGSEISTYQLFWADKNNEQIQGQVIKTLDVIDPAQHYLAIDLQDAVSMPSLDSQLKLIALNDQGEQLYSTMIRFLDFKGNAQVTGMGGTQQANWHYGLDREYLFANKETINETDTCSFDNGHVMIIDMNNEKDPREVHELDDEFYPAFNFDCTNSLVNSERIVYDFDEEVLTYSALNDSLHYGTVVYNMFYKYLGRPAYSDKMRLRVHYAKDYNSDIFWSGAYANFGDERYFSNGSTSLDIIAHELAHGFLDKNTGLNLDNFSDLILDAFVLHEAFADISGAAAKYHYTGQLHWLHGQEIDSSSIRDTSKIVTAYGAVPSFFDYDEAKNDDVDTASQYRLIGLISYPFYLLTNKWGMDRSYFLFIQAAERCWGNISLQLAAECVLQTAEVLNEPTEDVIEAFKAVKIKLFDEGSLAHFQFTPKKRAISFSDTSFTTENITQWHWDFGDGNTSEEQEPTHEYEIGGKYNPKLTITDSLGETDSFTREIDVFTGYCSDKHNRDTDRIIKQVTIDGQLIDSSLESDRWDYTNRTITIVDGNSVRISINEEKTTQRSSDWKIWLDANDDGVFDNSINSNEILYSDSIYDGQPGLDVTVKIPENSVSGPLRLRIATSFVVISPCSTGMLSSFDTMIEMQ